VNTIEFRLRENNYGNFPQGLAIMLRSLSAWLYDADPTSLLAFESSLNQVKQNLKSGGFLEGLIDRHLLGNPHRTVVLLQPEPGLAAKEIEEEAKRLEGIKNSLPHDEIGRVIENAKTLKSIQSSPDSPEALATIPVLRVSDLDRATK